MRGKKGVEFYVQDVCRSTGNETSKDQIVFDLMFSWN
jgi:hypothetical protein